MNNLRCCIVIVACMTLVASTSQQQGHATQRENTDTLQLTTSILSERYCSPNTLELTLELTFTNNGSRALILDKNSSIIGSYMVSRDSDASIKKKYELKVSPMKNLLTSGLRPGPPEESRFVVLKPSQTHVLQKIIYLNLWENRDKTQSSLTPGSHVLQLSVWTWYYPPTMAEEYRERWNDKGVLWSDIITSKPMPFVVASGASRVPCSE